MSDQWPVTHLQGPKSPTRPFSTASHSTAHMSLADSRASVVSGWTVSGESADVRFHYSQFPIPPLDIPGQPRLSVPSTASSPSTPTTSYRFTPNQLIGASIPSMSSFPVQERPEFPRNASPALGLRVDVSADVASSNAPSVPEKVLLPSPVQSSKRTQELTRLEVAKTHAIVQVERVPTHRASSPRGPEEWNDGASVISVNPSEENLLSTSFISSLLTQGLNNGAAGGPPTAWDRHKYLRKPLNVETQSSGQSSGPSSPSLQIPGNTSSVGSVRDSVDNRTIRAPRSSSYVPSERSRTSGVPSTRSAYSSRPPAEPQPSPVKASPTFTHSGESSAFDSRRGSDEYSETLHSGEVRSAVRTASLTLPAQPVGVVQARTIQRDSQKSEANLTVTKDTTQTRVLARTPPPGHHADAPQSVTGHTEFTHGDTDPDVHDAFHRKTSSFDSLSPALPSGSHGRFRGGEQMGEKDSLSRYLRRNQSLRSVVSSIASRVSKASRASRASVSSSVRQAKYLAWLRVRPLPPLPIPPRPGPSHVLHDADKIQKYEEQIPLPVLAKRAGALESMLEGDHPTNWSTRASSRFHDYRNDGVYVIETISPNPGGGFSTGQRASQLPRDRRSRHKLESIHEGNPPSPSHEKRPDAVNSKMRRIWIFVGIGLVAIMLVIVLPVWLTRKRNAGSSSPICNGNMTGFNCDIDATCVCASASGQCHLLAQGILSLIPDVNSIFKANFTPTMVSSAIFDAQGNSADGTCVQQAVLIDTAPSLDKRSSPSRARWAQAALLWNLVLSEDTGATNALRTFINRTDWSALGTQDGIVEDSSGRFRTIQSGYMFDFAAQQISPISKTFTDNSRVTEEQAARVSYISGNVLNNMFSIASSASTQSQKALQTFWRSVLQQQPEDLPAFLDAVRNSPFVIPFNAANTAVTSLMTPSESTQFPVPLSCYPSLSSQQLQQIGNLESIVFGLSSPSARSSFNVSCYPDRPTYGLVNLLRLRLPFPDDRGSASRQSSQLGTDTLSRAVIYSGEIVSGMPDANTIPAPLSLDPSQFGTTDNLNRVLLTYLSSISDVTLAMELVQFVLSRSPVPPPSSSRLISSFSDIPALEFAIFGSIIPQDIVTSYSSFALLNGTLFFGSDSGQRFRDWATVNPSSSIVWSANGTSQQIARETAARNDAFESVWDSVNGSSQAQSVLNALADQGLLSRN